jgi:hypothetical protein
VGHGEARQRGQCLPVVQRGREQRAGFCEKPVRLLGQPASFESEVPFASRGTRWIRAQYIPDRDANGNVQGCVSLVLDVTDAKHAEQRLAEEARLNETLYRVGTALAQDLDLDTVFARLTDEATALRRAQFGAFFYNVDDPERGRYMLYTLAGVPREKFAGFPMPRNTDVFAPTFAGEGVVRSDDITKDARYRKSAPYHGMPAGHLPVRSYLAVPVSLGKDSDLRMTEKESTMNFTSPRGVPTQL